MVHTVFESFLILTDHKRQFPFPGPFVPEPVNFAEFIARIDMDHRERDLSKERFAAQPKKRRGIFPHRPQETGFLKALIRFPNNIDGLTFKFVQMMPAHFFRNSRAGVGEKTGQSILGDSPTRQTKG